MARFRILLIISILILAPSLALASFPFNSLGWTPNSLGATSTAVNSVSSIYMGGVFDENFYLMAGTQITTTAANVETVGNVISTSQNAIVGPLTANLVYTGYNVISDPANIMFHNGGTTSENSVIVGVQANVIYSSNGVNGAFFTTNGVVPNAANALTFNVLNSNSFALIFFGEAGGAWNSINSNALTTDSNFCSVQANVIENGRADGGAMTCNNIAAGSYNAVINQLGNSAGYSYGISAYIFPPYSVVLNGVFIVFNGIEQPNGANVPFIGTNSLQNALPSSYTFNSWIATSGASNVIIESPTSPTSQFIVEGAATILESTNTVTGSCTGLYSTPSFNSNVTYFNSDPSNNIRLYGNFPSTTNAFLGQNVIALNAVPSAAEANLFIPPTNAFEYEYANSLPPSFLQQCEAISSGGGSVSINGHTGTAFSIVSGNGANVATSGTTTTISVNVVAPLTSNSQGVGLPYSSNLLINNLNQLDIVNLSTAGSQFLKTITAGNYGITISCIGQSCSVSNNGVITANGQNGNVTVGDAAGDVYYFYPQVSSIAGYNNSAVTPYSTLTTISNTLPNSAASYTIWNSITPSLNIGNPNIPAGDWECNLAANQPSGLKASQLYCNFYEANAIGGNIISLGTTQTSLPLTTIQTSYSLDWYAPNVITLRSSTDRIITQIVAVETGAGITAANVVLYMGGTSDSYITIPTAAQIVSCGSGLNCAANGIITNLNISLSQAAINGANGINSGKFGYTWTIGPTSGSIGNSYLTGPLITALSINSVLLPVNPIGVGPAYYSFLYNPTNTFVDFTTNDFDIKNISYQGTFVKSLTGSGAFAVTSSTGAVTGYSPPYGAGTGLGLTATNTFYNTINAFVFTSNTFSVISNTVSLVTNSPITTTPLGVSLAYYTNGLNTENGNLANTNRTGSGGGGGIVYTFNAPLYANTITNTVYLNYSKPLFLKGNTLNSTALTVILSNQQSNNCIWGFLC